MSPDGTGPVSFRLFSPPLFLVNEDLVQVLVGAFGPLTYQKRPNICVQPPSPSVIQGSTTTPSLLFQPLALAPFPVLPRLLPPKRRGVFFLK